MLKIVKTYKVQTSTKFKKRAYVFVNITQLKWANIVTFRPKHLSVTVSHVFNLQAAERTFLLLRMIAHPGFTSRSLRISTSSLIYHDLLRLL